LKAKFSSSITSGDRNMACCFALKGACELWIPVSKNYCSVLGGSTIIIFFCIRCKETSVFAVAHILSHFFCISLMSLFTDIPAFTMFAISCHALFFPQKLSTRKTLLSNNFSLLVLLFVSISFRTLQVPIDNARFYCFVRINIQGRVCLNVTIRDCWK
jgi:lipid-A-disaccharide synthase-like uncharacterized protein